jgi:hypothetical protein
MKILTDKLHLMNGSFTFQKQLQLNYVFLEKTMVIVKSPFRLAHILTSIFQYEFARKLIWTLLVLFIFPNTDAKAQLEKIFVETYYITDANDASDITGGGISTGTTTYRVYADLAPGSRILEIFGDENHPFEIISTETFYNNAEGGTFGHNIPKIAYESNVVALDTYLAIGQNGSQGTKKYYGIPKSYDDDGSFIGGENNDGGSEMISGGLLVNNDVNAGIPLTVSDGMDTLEFTPSNWFNFGILDLINGNDSTMFGHLQAKESFVSNNFSLRNDGVYGVIPDSNHVLIAQLTTSGTLTFKLNIKVLVNPGPNQLVMTYVGTNFIDQENQQFNPYLIYPQACGCIDPQYVEYNPQAVCEEEGACQNLHVFGCTDTLACNYDPTATLNVVELCCYPGFCAERDLEKVCPQLMGDSFDVSVFPNPAQDNIQINVISGIINEFVYHVYNQNGMEMESGTMVQNSYNQNTTLDVSEYSPGIYTLLLNGDLGYKQILFVIIP